MEYAIGYSVGITQTLVGYPLDTIKTRLQNSNVTRITPGVKLAVGIRFPLVNSTIINTMTFGNRDLFQKFTENKLVSYTLVGITNGIVQNQLDYCKVKAQTKGTIPKFPRKFVTTGMKYSVALEALSMPIYFSTYEYLKYFRGYSDFNSGGWAGVNCWLWTYPIDTLKSRSFVNPKLKLHELIQIQRGGGIFGLYSGLGVALLRAYIVNGFVFSTYNILSDIIRTR